MSNKKETGSGLRTELAMNLAFLSALYGKTQSDLCEETGIPKSSMSAYFTGARYPRPEQLEAIAKCFNISVGRLVGWVDAGEEKIKDLPFELREIADKGRRLTPQQRQELLRYCVFTYREAFDDQYRYMGEDPAED